MSKIFKNMIPYWKSILVILVLLFVQAWCDLSLPSYTSDIIDVGIQNSGVEHVTPKRITEEEFQTAKFIMTDDEADLWESLYTKKDGYYERNKASEKELDDSRRYTDRCTPDELPDGCDGGELPSNSSWHSRPVRMRPCLKT